MYGLLGISMGLGVGAGYAYYKKAQEQSSTILNENIGKTSPVMETAPSFQISREVFLYWLYNQYYQQVINVLIVSML